MGKKQKYNTIRCNLHSLYITDLRPASSRTSSLVVFILLRILAVVLTNSSPRVFCSVCRLPYVFVPGIFIICELDTLHVKVQSPPQGSGE